MILMITATYTIYLKNCATLTISIVWLKGSTTNNKGLTMKWNGSFRVNGKSFEWIRNASNGSLDIFDFEGNKIGYAKTIAMAKKIASRHH